MTWDPYSYYLGAEPTVREHRRGEGPVRDHRGEAPVVRDHRRPDARVTTPPFPSPTDHRPPVKPPVVQPPVVQPPVVQPPVVQPPAGEPPAGEPQRPRRHPDAAPREHHRHRDYVFVPGYDWWPRWFPYWDPYWYWYWQYLYWYYQGYTYPEYAEAARDAYLRSIAPQWGWM